MDWIAVIIAAFFASLPGFYAIYRGGKKADAEAAETIGKAYKSLFDELNERITALEAKLKEKDQQVADLEDEVDALRTLMRERGIEPPPRRRPRK